MPRRKVSVEDCETIWMSRLVAFSTNFLLTPNGMIKGVAFFGTSLLFLLVVRVRM